jgi:hypothetical protein
MHHQRMLPPQRLMKAFEAAGESRSPVGQDLKSMTAMDGQFAVAGLGCGLGNPNHSN